MEEITIEVPVEPPNRSVVLAADGVAWQRTGEGWMSTMGFALLSGGTPWANLLIQRGPVRVIHWASTEGGA